jgi:hypothetical protein
MATKAALLLPQTPPPPPPPPHNLPRQTRRIIRQRVSERVTRHYNEGSKLPDSDDGQVWSTEKNV